MRFTSSASQKIGMPVLYSIGVHAPASADVEMLLKVHFTGNICPRKLSTSTETSSSAKIITGRTAKVPVEYTTPGRKTSPLLQMVSVERTAAGKTNSPVAKGTT